MKRYIRPCVVVRLTIVICMTLSAGCNGNGIGVPTINPFPADVIPPDVPESNTLGQTLLHFEAVVSSGGSAMPNGYRTHVAYSWQMPPGQEADSPRMVLEAQRSSSDPTRWFAEGIDNRFQHGQIILQEWSVENANGDTVAITSPLRAFQVGCPDGPEPDLIADQIAMVNQFGGLTTLDEINGAGYGLDPFGLPHRLVNLDGVGVIFSNVFANPTPTPGDPLLLFYSSSTTSEDGTGVPIAPFSLIGWGYGTISGPPAERPMMACFPYHEWLEHLPGWHLPNGDFLFDNGVNEPSGPTDGHHGNGWAFHVWRRGANGDVPDVGESNGQGNPPGAFNPADWFEYPPMVIN